MGYDQTIVGTHQKIMDLGKPCNDLNLLAKLQFILDLAIVGGIHTNLMYETSNLKIRVTPVSHKLEKDCTCTLFQI